MRWFITKSEMSRTDPSSPAATMARGRLMPWRSANRATADVGAVLV
jgi:hypothetical protein